MAINEQDSPFRVAVLGSLSLTTADGVAVTPASGRIRRLLAALVVEDGNVVSVDRLAEVIWGQDQPVDAPAGVQTLISRLRRQLPDTGVQLLTRAPGYRLQIEDGALDAQRFTRLVAQARACRSSDPGGAGDLLTTALELWRGPAYAEFADEPFARAEAARLEELRSAAAQDQIEAWLAIGRADSAIAKLEVIRAADPLRERPAAQLIRALHQAGRTAEALQVYRDQRDLLAAELGLEPSAELRRVHELVLRGDPIPQPGDPMPQLGDSMPPPGDRLAAPDRDRPAQVGPELIGRADLTAQIVRELAEAPLITLTGPGGVGKSSLARWVIADRQDQLTAWWCDLAAVEQPAAVPDKVLTVLGALGTPAPARTRVVEVLRARSGLLVLDNAEHVIHAVAELVTAVLADCPGIRVLVTSRERVGVRPERLLPVSPLSLPESGAVRLDSALASPAVELFVRRTRESDPGFDLTTVNAAEVTELCRRLDGLPLALELAATRMRSMTPVELLDRMSWRFRLLRGGPRLGDDRHRSLQALVDWSYDLLDEPGRRTFDRVCVFAGAFSLADAEAVVPDAGIELPDVADRLADLVDRSLVIARPAAGGTRFVLLETLRAYGRDRLALAADPDAAARAHARHLAAVAGRAGGLYGPDNRDRVADLDQRMDELRAATLWAIEHDRALAAALVESLAPYAEQRVQTEVFGWADRTLAAYRAGPDPAIPPAGLLGTAALGARSRGDLDEAVRLAEQSLELAEHPEAAALALVTLSDVALFRSDPAGALRWSQHLEEGLGDSATLAQRVWIWSGRALGQLYAGQDVEVVAEAQQVRHQGESGGEPVLAAWAAYVLAEAWGETCPEQAIGMAEEALVRGRHLDERFLSGVALVAAASLQARHGRPVRAARLFVEVVDWWRSAGNWTQQWIALRSCVGLLIRLEQFREAAVLLGALAGRATAAEPYGPDARRLARAQQELAGRLASRELNDLTAQGKSLSDREVVERLRSVLKSVTGVQPFSR